MMKSLPLYFLYVLALTATGFAQVAGMGTISGTVRDASGAAVPEAQVVVANESKGIRRTMQTTEAGVFSAPSLVPAAGYVVSVEKAGFCQTRVEGRSSSGRAKAWISACFSP